MGMFLYWVLCLLVMVRVRYSFGSRHTGRIANIKKQRGKYPEVMRDVVRISDIVLEILDARFVGEMRNLEVEADVLAKGKKLIYVLNKCDLLRSRESWVVSRGDMEGSLPKEMKPYVFVSATKGIGLRDLKAKIKIEARKISKKFSAGCRSSGYRGVGQRKVHVGVIGYPNAGKSSVINMITRRGVAKTAKQAGFTKGMQKIRMSEGILILDTPGVIPDSEYSTLSGSFAKDVRVGARSSGDVRDPEGAVAFLLEEEKQQIASLSDRFFARSLRCQTDLVFNRRLIEGFYGIDAGGDVEVLIEELGKKKGFLGKGGVVDVDRTARLILRDWQLGRIK